MPNERLDYTSLDARVEVARRTLLARYQQGYEALVPPIDVGRLAGLVGARIKKKTTTFAGALYFDRGSLEIHVSARDNRLRQRFTVAHEIIHILLDDHRLRSGAVEGPATSRERAIDAAAARLLVPPELLPEHFRPEESLSISALMRLGRLFGVTLPVIVRRLFSEEALRGSNWGVIVARREPNPRTYDRTAVRVVDAISAGQWFLPRHVKVEKLGFSSILRCAREGSPDESTWSSDRVRFKIAPRPGAPLAWSWQTVQVELRRFGTGEDPVTFALFRLERDVTRMNAGDIGRGSEHSA